MSCCHLISSHFAETAATPDGETVLGLMIGTAVTVLLLVCSIAGMILKRLSRNDRSNISEVVQGSPGEEYMQMERKTMEQEETRNGEIERTEVRYQVTAPDNVNSESNGGAYNGREHSMGRGMIDSDKLGLPGTSYVSSHVAEHGRIHGSDQGINHGSRNTVIQQSADRTYMCGSEHMTSHGMDPGSMTGDPDCEEEWGGYGHQDTRILLPSHNSYSPYQRTNVKLNPIFE